MAWAPARISRPLMLASTMPRPPGVRGGAPRCRRWSRPAPGRAAGRLQSRGGRPVSSEVEAGRPAVSRTACHHFLSGTALIVSRSLSNRLSGPVSGRRRPRVTQFHRRCAARPSTASGRSVRMTITPKAANRTNPAMPSRAVWMSPALAGASARMAGSARIGSASRPPTWSSENAVRPPTAVSVSVSNPRWRAW